MKALVVQPLPLVHYKRIVSPGASRSDRIELQIWIQNYHDDSAASRIYNH